jgi:hypothetical protein
MANSNGWGDGSANNAIGWGQGANNAVSWGSSHATSLSGLTNIVGGVPLDADASAFITAAAITDATQQSAIDTLVTGLKTDGLWTKMKAIYPFVGGTATSHKFNLKDPRDLDAAFRLTFSGGWTHSSTGALPNGTNAYADTKVINNTNLTDKQSHFSAYLRTLNTGVGWFGLFNGSSIFGLQQNANATNVGVGTNNLTGYLATPSIGYYIGSTNITTGNIYKNGNLVYNAVTINPIVQNLNFYLGALNSSGTAALFNTHQYSVATLGDSLNATDAGKLNTRIQAFQTTLGRQV